MKINKNSLVTLLQHGKLPEPVRATFDEMIRARLDCMRVKVRGVVRSADMVTEDGSHIIKIHMVVDGGYVDVAIVSGLMGSRPIPTPKVYGCGISPRLRAQLSFLDLL